MASAEATVPTAVFFAEKISHPCLHLPFQVAFLCFMFQVFITNSILLMGWAGNILVKEELIEWYPQC